MSSRVIVLDCREVNSLLFRVVFGRSPWEAALRGTGARAGCPSEELLSLCKTMCKNSRRTDQLIEKLLAELKCKKILWKLKVRMGYKG